MSAAQTKSLHAASAEPSASLFDAEAFRARFPILQRTVHGRPLIYLDSAATAQKPREVIDAVAHYYERSNANVHRGVHQLSLEATEGYEGARRACRTFINAADDREIIFTRGATEAINLVANAWGSANVAAGDEVLITHMEHHSNIVPWQMLCERSGAALKVAPVTDRGELDMDAFRALLSERTKIISVVHISNTLGTINPIAEITRLAHDVGALVMIDGAQAAPHLPVDVRAIGCDFYAVAGHKMFGPTGIGFLHGRSDLLRAMPPWQGGGDMIRSVSFDGTTYADPPARFEAGTPNIAGAAGLRAAIDMLSSIDRASAQAHEDALVVEATRRLREIDGVRIIGEAEYKCGVVSFVIEGIHPHDLGTVLDAHGVAIRTGHHCTQPLMDRFGVPATARASFLPYNTMRDVDALHAAVREAIDVLR